MVYRNDKLLKAVRELPCQRCGAYGRTQAAHRNQGKGMGIKNSDAQVAALCVDCHREIDQGRDMSRAERRAELDAAIVKTMTALIEGGILQVRE